VNILIAEDDVVSRRLLQDQLRKAGHEILVTEDGQRAWEALQAPDAPRLALIDWMMPGIDGLELCRLARKSPRLESMYLILVTARNSKDDIVRGLEAGADDYIAKPVNNGELRARVQVGLRVLGLQSALADRVKELEEAASREKQLAGLLPICSYCKKIRDDHNYWHQVESYIIGHANVRFSHGICPECTSRVTTEMGRP